MDASNENSAHTIIIVHIDSYIVTYYYNTTAHQTAGKNSEY